METRELLRATVADFFEVDPGAVGPGFPLTGRLGQGSIARAALDSVIRRRLGMKSKAVYSALTFGELEAALLPDGDSQPAAPPAGPAVSAAPASREPAGAASLQPAGAAIACGIDIELVENLPPAADYWEHEFYASFFTPKEIAYCLVQESPRIHFAGRWCVKEALKKCDPELLSEEMKNIELASDEAGAPFLCRYIAGEARRLPHAVSIAHTPQAAIAVVVKLNGAALAGPAVRASEESSPGSVAAMSPAHELARNPRSSSGFLVGLAALTALLLSLLALWRTFHS